MLPRSPNGGYWEIAPTRSSTARMGKLRAPRTRGNGRGSSTSVRHWLTLRKPGVKMPPVRITLPDGTIVSSEQSDRHQILSTVLKREVTLDAIEHGHREIGG